MKEYRIKDEKFRKYAQEMAGFSLGGDLPLEHFVSQESSAMRTRLEEYGVFELWFEEIRFESKDYIYIKDSGNIYQIDNCEVIGEVLHWNAAGMDRGYKYRFCSPLNNVRLATKEEIEESKFKSGDYIYIIATGNIYEIDNCEVMENQLHWNAVGMNRGYKYRFSTLLSNIRHATAEEIEDYKQPLPYINGYKGKRDGEYIVYGCQKVNVQDFRRLYEACLCMDVVVDSITIAGQQVQIETLQEIYEKTY